MDVSQFWWPLAVLAVLRAERSVLGFRPCRVDVASCTVRLGLFALGSLYYPLTRVVSRWLSRHAVLGTLAERSRERESGTIHQRMTV